MKTEKLELELYAHGAELFFFRHDRVQVGYIRTAKVTRFETWKSVEYGIMYFDGDDNVDITLAASALFATKQDLINSL